MADSEWNRHERELFVGMDADTAPDKLPDGYVPRCVNVEPDGGDLRLRDALRKFKLDWSPVYGLQTPEDYPTIRGMATGTFNDEEYPTVHFLVDSDGVLYRLYQPVIPEDKWAFQVFSFGQMFQAPVTVIRSVQMGKRVIMTDENVMVAAWAEDKTVYAEPLSVRETPGAPYFSEDWWDYYETAILGNVNQWIEPNGDGHTVAAVAYRLTYVWEDGTESGPGPRSEPYLLGAWGWSEWTLMPIPLTLPPWPTTAGKLPAFVNVYRSYCVNMFGFGEPGWSAFNYVGRAGYGTETWSDSTGVVGASIPEQSMSNIPVGKHLITAGEEPRLFIGSTKEGIDQNPSDGTMYTAFGGNGVWSPEDADFSTRIRIDIQASNRTLWGGGMVLYLQNTDSNQRDCRTLPGGFVPADRLAYGAGLNVQPIRHRFTLSDGTTPIISRVETATSESMKVWIQMPQLFPSVSQGIYLYYDESLPAEEPAALTAMNYFGMRHPFGADDDLRMNGGLYFYRANTAIVIDENVGRPACSSSVLTYLLLEDATYEPQYEFTDADIMIATKIDERSSWPGGFGANMMARRRTLTIPPVAPSDPGTDCSWHTNRAFDDCQKGTLAFRMWIDDLSGVAAWCYPAFITSGAYPGGAPWPEIFLSLRAVGNDLEFSINTLLLGQLVVTNGNVDIENKWFYVGITWSDTDATLWLFGFRDGEIVHDAGIEAGGVSNGVPITATFAGIITPANMTNLVLHFLYNDTPASPPLPEYDAHIGDVLFTTSRVFSQTDHIREAFMLSEPGKVAYAATEEEVIGERENFPNRARWSDPDDPQVWPILGYRDCGNAGDEILGLGAFKNHIVPAKAVGVWPILARGGGSFEFLNESGLTETMFWNPQTQSAEERGFAGCSVPGGLLSTPDGIWMISGTKLLRYDTQRFWDHSDGVRKILLEAGNWWSNTPIKLFYEPMRDNLLMSWLEDGEWRTLGLRATFVAGKKVWGWFEHDNYNVNVVGQSMGTGDAQLLLSDGTDVYFFDPYLRDDQVGNLVAIMETAHARLVRGMMRGWGLSFETDSMLAASLYMNGQAVKSYVNLVSDKQYPAPASAINEAYLVYTTMELS